MNICTLQTIVNNCCCFFVYLVYENVYIVNNSEQEGCICLVYENVYMINNSEHLVLMFDI